MYGLKCTLDGFNMRGGNMGGVNMGGVICLQYRGAHIVSAYDIGLIRFALD